ncbi:MAG: hypothetical protein Q8K15_02120 [Candidatus Omnitrophota bacterium]|nr:hypothetical protein [Candidatus Omnitrophota bacterium]
MRLTTRKLTGFFLFLQILFIFSFGLRAEDLGADFEQALKNIEAQKNREREELTSRLDNQLNQVVDSWIQTANTQKKAQLDQLVEQNWEKLSLTYALEPVHYDYFLRGAAYKKTKSDIIRTESLTATYKAHAIITETLYVERYHSPDISDADPYFFTVTNQILLNLEYIKNDFIITSTDYKTVNIENSCPEWVKRIRL